MNHAELVMRRRNVLEFIKVDPVSIQFSRSGTPQKTAAGGFVKPDATLLAPQQARIILNRRRYTDGIVNSEAGDIPHTDYLLVGMHTLNIEKEDAFIYLGENYKITGIYGARIESVLAAIDFLGPVNRDA